MLKKRFKLIIFIVILIISLTIPIVRATEEDPEVTTENIENQTLLTNDTQNDIMLINDKNMENPGSEETSQIPIPIDVSDAIKTSDVYLNDKNVVIDYIVDGNLFVIADTVTINSQISGDAFIIANSITIGEQGSINSNLFSISETINLNGSVYDIYSMAETINISGRVYRDIRVGTNSLNIKGTIERNAYVSCDNITFETNTDTSSIGSIEGDLNYTSAQSSDIPENAVAGDVNFNQKIIESSTKTLSDKIFNLISFVATVAIIWLLLLWLAPKFAKTCDKLLISKPLIVIGLGILTPILLVCAFIALIMLNITAYLSLICLTIFFMILLINSSIFVIALNNILCNKLKIHKNLGIFGMLVATSIVFWLIKLIPTLGGLIAFITSILGIGIIISNLILKNADTQK